MKVLVTGAGGQLGRDLVRTAPSYINLVACAHAELDISDPDAVTSCIGIQKPEVIINAAAYTAVDEAEREQGLAQRINVDGPRHLAQVSQDTQARLIHISTDFVFDGTACVPYKPEAATNPLNVYGVTKRAGEIAILDALPMRSVILRTAWLYAAQGNNFVRKMLQLMRDNGSVRVVADQIGTPTSTRSLAHTLWKIVENPQVEGIHHWTDAGVASWYDLAVAVAEEGATFGLVSSDVAVTPVATHDYLTPARRPSYSVLDTTSLRALAITRVHWRKRLRTALEEIRDA